MYLFDFLHFSFVNILKSNQQLCVTAELSPAASTPEHHEKFV